MKYMHSFLLFFLFAFPAWVLWNDPAHYERTPASFASSSCRELIENLSDINVAGNARRVRAAFGLTDATIGNGKLLQFGFESEYGLSEIDKIVSIYGPHADLGISSDQWFAMPVAERSQWVRDNIRQLFPESRKAGKLVKLKNQSGFGFLPEALIQDDTGNLEFVIRPFNTYEEWFRAVKKINQKFGAGSMQATVSAPPESFFGQLEGMNKALSVNEKIGMFNFYSDYDILQKLNAGHLRYQDDQSLSVARNFEHPFLGPMTNTKQRQLHTMLRGNANGQRYDVESLSQISELESSFKYVGGTTYRPDIVGKDRVILEVRDAHKNFSLLNDRVLRSLFFMQHGTKGFDKLKDLKSFHFTDDFQKLPKEVRDELARLFPNKANPNYQYTAAEKKSLDVFRNFAYPMRDWSDHLSSLNAVAIADQVESAQAAYKSKLSDIVTRLKAQSISDDDAAREIQAALAEFSHSSGLAKAFENYEENVIFAGTNNRAFNEFVREATIEAGPLADSFPEKIWAGELKDRVDLLMQRYPDRIKKFDGIKFQFNNQPGGRRDVIAISLNGLDDEAKQALINDYLAAVSENTVSFPLSEQAGHLYTRVGNRSYDFLGSIDADPYPLPYSNRLESFVELESDEFMRLRTYVDNAKENTDDVVGDFTMGGAADGTNGTLTNNVPTTGGHNCTSWMCTAPIGDGGESLHQLTGAPVSHNVHTNPGWWSSWLSNYAQRDRVPFLVYLSNDSVDDVTQRFSDPNSFQWNFGEH